MYRCLLLSAVMVFFVALATSAAAENRHAAAVIIGNRGYGKGVPEVAYAHRDAEAMKRLVVEVLGYREANVIDLRDATQAEMYSVFGNRSNHRGKAFSYVRPGKSDLLVFYSGHGVPGLHDGRGYLLPVDADPATADINGYPIDLLYANLSKLGARSVTVLIDACFSGDSPAGPLVRAASPVYLTAALPPPAGMTVLTAASRGQVASWDEKARHGLFTHHLLQGLYGRADGGDWGDGDGAVTLGEIARYLRDEMTYRARRLFAREQTPTVHGDPALVLARYPEDSAAPAVAALPPSPMPAPEPPSLVPVEATYVAVRNANVRAEPSVRSKRVSVIRNGEQVYVAGRTEDGAWLAVERDGRPLGFVYARLLEQSPPAGAAAKGEPAPEASTTQKVGAPEPDLHAEIAYWNSIVDESDPRYFREYLERFPTGSLSSIAKARIRELEGREADRKRPSEGDFSQFDGTWVGSTATCGRPVMAGSGGHGERRIEIVLEIAAGDVRGHFTEISMLGQPNRYREPVSGSVTKEAGVYLWSSTLDARLVVSFASEDEASGRLNECPITLSRR